MVKKYNYTKKTGRPSSYEPKFCDEIIKYFSVEPYREVEIIHKNKNDEKYSTYELKANDLRFISGFARSIKVTHETLLEWSKTHPEFSVALKEAKELQKEHLITNGLQNLFAQPFAIFTAKNILGWRDRPEETTPDELINNQLSFPTVPQNGDGKERLKQYFN